MLLDFLVVLSIDSAFHVAETWLCHDVNTDTTDNGGSWESGSKHALSTGPWPPIEGDGTFGGESVAQEENDLRSAASGSTRTVRIKTPSMAHGSGESESAPQTTQDEDDWPRVASYREGCFGCLLHLSMPR